MYSPINEVPPMATRRMAENIHKMRLVVIMVHGFNSLDMNMPESLPAMKPPL
jgi:hypothetical protein